MTRNRQMLSAVVYDCPECDELTTHTRRTSCGWEYLECRQCGKELRFALPVGEPTVVQAETAEVAL